MPKPHIGEGQRALALVDKVTKVRVQLLEQILLLLCVLGNTL